MSRWWYLKCKCCIPCPPGLRSSRICASSVHLMQHLEEEYIPTVCSSFHTWKSKHVWLNWCLMDRLWKLGLMFSRWEICGEYWGPLGKGDCFANSTSVNSRAKVVQGTECWACISWVDPTFLEWLRNWNCCWNMRLLWNGFSNLPCWFPEQLSKLLVLTMHWYFCPCNCWSDFQISYQYIRI